MSQFLRLRKWVATTLIENRWLIILLFGAATLIFEIIENFDVHDPVDVHLVREIIFFGVIYPLLAFWLLNDLLTAQAERKSLAWQQEHKRQLNHDLGQAKDIQELQQVIVSFPVKIAPVMGAVLYQPAPESGEMVVVAECWPAGGKRPAQAFPTLSPNFCDLAAHLPGRGLHPLMERPFMTETAMKGYCLPLHHLDTIIAQLHIYQPQGENLTADQKAVLALATPIMALALDTRLTQNEIDMQAVATRKERERIARHLHDTLGHKLAYIQIMMDELTEGNTVAGITSIQQDLERIRNVSNEAYLQVRQTVLTMQADSMPEFTEALLGQAEAVAQQADLELHFMVDGDPQSLPPLDQRKLLFIMREALNNVQRHAQATIVDLCVSWSAGALTIDLVDNGVGFNPCIELENGHFGLLIMTQRAEEIDAKLSVISAPYRGTHIGLRYCLNYPGNMGIQM